MTTGTLYMNPIRNRTRADQHHRSQTNSSSGAKSDTGMKMYQFLQQTQLFNELNTRQLEKIAPHIIVRQYMPQDLIFFQGDPGDKLYLIQSGQVRIFINGLDGSETSVILCGRPGEVFGELAVIDGLTRSASAVAMTETVLYTISRDRFRQIMQENPQIALNFMKILSKKVRYNTHQVDSLASLDISRRLARKLLELGQDYGTAETNGVRISTPLTQSNLASLIVATRESINKVMRTFREQGLIETEGRHIILCDVAALREEAAA